MATDEYGAEEGEENVYHEDAREELVDNDELTPEEEAFMRGYDEDEEKTEKESEEEGEENE